MIRVVFFLLTMLVASNAFAARSGVVRGRLLFYNQQIGFTNSPGGHDWYNGNEFNAHAPVRHAFVSVVDASGNPLGNSFTDVNGWYTISWYSSGNPTTGLLRVYWTNNGYKFRVVNQQNGYWISDYPIQTLTNGTTTANPQGWPDMWSGWAGVSHPWSNVYDGAWRMYWYALKYHSALSTNLINKPIRYPSTACPTSCGNQNGIDLDTGATTPYATPFRVAHELGHVAQSLTASGQNASPCLKYSYPATTANGGWTQESSEWSCGAYMEGFASFLATVSRHWYQSTLARECRTSDTGVCTLNVETSGGSSCTTAARRMPITTQRFLWDSYDTANDGEADAVAYAEMIGVHGAFAPGTGDGQRDEWNNGAANLSGGNPIETGAAGFDGQSVGDWWWNYWFIHGIALQASYNLNCIVPYD